MKTNVDNQVSQLMNAIRFQVISLIYADIDPNLIEEIDGDVFIIPVSETYPQEEDINCTAENCQCIVTKTAVLMTSREILLCDQHYNRAKGIMICIMDDLNELKKIGLKLEEIIMVEDDLELPEQVLGMKDRVLSFKASIEVIEDCEDCEEELEARLPNGNPVGGYNRPLCINCRVKEATRIDKFCDHFKNTPTDEIPELRGWIDTLRYREIELEEGNRVAAIADALHDESKYP